MDFKKLAEEVKAATLGSSRMTDIATGTYHIDIDGEKISLISDTKHKVPVNTFATLAALRIASDPIAAKNIKNTREARDHKAVISNLQDAVTNEPGFVLSGDTKFTVVHRLQIMDAETEQPTFRNECYKGYPAYVKAARKAAALPSVSDDQKTARNLEFTEASENLHKSGLKAGIKQDDSTYLLMPVFTVTK